MGRKSQRKGDVGETIGGSVLASMGFGMIEPIETGFHRTYQNGRLVLVPKAKVAGDLRAIVPGSGRSVLVEVKRYAGKLQHSKLTLAQHSKLREHDRLGGISLLIWIDDASDQIFVLRYPVPGFKRNTSLRPEQADKLQLYGRYDALDVDNQR